MGYPGMHGVSQRPAGGTPHRPGSGLEGHAAPQKSTTATKRNRGTLWPTLRQPKNDGAALAPGRMAGPVRAGPCGTIRASSAPSMPAVGRVGSAGRITYASRMHPRRRRITRHAPASPTPGPIGLAAGYAAGPIRPSTASPRRPARTLRRRVTCAPSQADGSNSTPTAYGDEGARPRCV